MRSERDPVGGRWRWPGLIALILLLACVPAALQADENELWERDCPDTWVPWEPDPTLVGCWEPWTGMPYEYVLIDPGLEGMWEATYLAWSDLYSSGDPEPDLNHDLIEFQRSGLRAFMHGNKEGYPGWSADLRRVCKLFVRATVLEGKGQLNEWWQDGTLYGVEIFWFTPLTGELPDSDDVLGTVGSVMSVDGDGDLVHLTYVFAYDKEGFEARLAYLEDDHGGPLPFYRVWEDATLTASKHDKKVEVKGEANVVCGPSASANDLKVSDEEARLQDGGEYVEKLDVEETAVIGPTKQVSGIVVPGTPISVATARAAAKAGGTYYTEDAKFKDDAPPKGLVFSEKGVSVERSYLKGAYTFVSATGKVHIKGDHSVITPAYGGICGLSYEKDVVLDGDGNEVRGEMLAPLGTAEVKGDDNLVLGILVGCEAKVDGERNVVSDGTHPIESPDYGE